MSDLVVIYGNCQAQVIGALSSGLLQDKYEFVYVPSVSSIGPVVLPDSVAERCVMLLEQVGVAQSFPFRDRLPPHVRHLRFPPLNLLALWPFSCTDPRNRPEPPEFPFGRYPYGDRIAIQLWKQGYCGREALARYAEASSSAMPDVSRMLERELTKLELIEGGCDIRISDYVRENIRLERLFHTYNHPTMKLIHMLFQRIWLTAAEPDHIALLCPLLEEHRERFLSDSNGWRPFENLQQPILPQVARQLGLDWWHEDIQYLNVQSGRMVTHDEFFELYLSGVNSTLSGGAAGSGG